MKSQKPYLDSRLTLTDLATMIDLPPQYLSQLFNEYIKENYFDYITKWRIEEAERLLKRGDKDMNIDDVGREAGFNSPASFNSAFIKFRGMGPGEFREKSGK